MYALPLLNEGTIMSDVIIDQKTLAKLHKIERAAKKLMLCFPDEIKESKDIERFTIPGYVVRDLRKAVK